MTVEEWFGIDEALVRADEELDRTHQPRLYDRASWFRLTAGHGLASRPCALRVADHGNYAWLFLAPGGARRAAPLASWYTLAFRAIATDPSLLAPLFRATARRFGRLALHPIVDSDLPASLAALRRSGWIAYAERSSTNWTVDVVPGDFAGYWKSRPGPLRSTVKRRLKTHPVRVAIHAAFDAAAWADYEAVYAASWKPAEGSLAFLRALAEQEGAAGTLRLPIAYDADGRPVAAQFWLIEDGHATIHKLAHREDAKIGSPGSLLTQAMFEHAIVQDRVHRVDFGLGEEAYKADWADTPRPVWRIDAYRPFTPRGAAGLARRLAARLARHRARG